MCYIHTSTDATESAVLIVSSRNQLVMVFGPKVTSNSIAKIMIDFEKIWTFVMRYFMRILSNKERIESKLTTMKNIG